MHGEGVYLWPGIQQCYVGQWKDGKRHGHGRHYFNSSSPDVDDSDPATTVGGDCYDGEWKEGVMHGEARYVDAGGEEHEGLWVDGVCPEVVRCKARKSFALVQRMLLPSGSGATRKLISSNINEDRYNLFFKFSCSLK